MPALALSDAQSPGTPQGLRGTEAGWTLSELAAEAGLDAAWDALSARAAAPTPFLSASCLRAHAEAGLAAGARLLRVRSGDRLLALLALAKSPVWFGIGPRLGRVWSSPYTPSSNPLVDATALEPAVAALLDGLAALGPGWLMPRLSTGTPTGRAILAEIRRRGWPQAELGAFGRPVLDLSEDLQAYLGRLGPRRAGDMRRRARRLRAQGEVALRSAETGDGLREGLEAFLALEAAGWKGRRGSAMASHPRSETLVRAFLEPPRAGPRLRTDLLLLDGRAIAASLALIEGGTAFMWKAAYDEAFAKASPGMVLEQEIVREAHRTRFAARLDSLAEGPTHLSGLYPDREEVADLVFLTDPRASRPAFERSVAAENARRRLIRQAKDGWWSLTDRSLR